MQSECSTPTPTPTPTQTPIVTLTYTLEPTATPTQTPTPTPTLEPNFNLLGINIICNAPTPTPTPTPTPFEGGAFDATKSFIFTINTENTGTSNGNEFSLPLNLSENYDFWIDWGDGGVIDKYTGTYSSLIHTYETPGQYDISICENTLGGFGRIYFNNAGDRLKVIDIKQWGTNLWSNFNSSFYGCANMTITATDAARANTGTVDIFTNAWRNCSSITSFPQLNMVSAINLGSAWRGCSNIQNFAQIDTSNVETFSSTWNGCSALGGFPYLNMKSMINGSLCFNAVTLSTSVYSQILNNLALHNLNNNVQFNAGSLSKYFTSSQSSKDTLANDRSWLIVDGGPE